MSARWLVLLWAMSACTDSAQPYIWHAKPLADAHPLWQKGSLQLSRTQEIGEQKRLLLLEGHTIESQTLKEKVLTHTTYEGQTFALLEIEDLKELDDIAKTLDPERHVCGAMQLIDPSVGLTQETPLIDPVHSPLKKHASIATLLDQVSVAPIKETIQSLSDFENRFHSTDSGTQAADAVYALLKKEAKAMGAEVEQITHSQTQQKSTRVILKGTKEPDTLVIIGAHLDSITGSGTTAPGADDDASGIGGLVAILQAITATGASFERTIELHAYAAEEVGLLGSGEMAASYKSSGKKVAVMLQMDMMTYLASTDSLTIHLITTDTNPTLTAAQGDLINLYQEISWRPSPLTAGTSDHKSWHNRGYPVTFAFQNPKAFNPYIHTPNDKADKLNSFSLATAIVKSNLAMIAHYGGLSDAESGGDPVLEGTAKEKGALAIWQDAEGEWRFSLARDDASPRVQICQLNASFDECTGERWPMAYQGDLGGRKVYTSEAVSAPKTGDAFQLMLYDENYELKSYRRVQLGGSKG